MPGWACRASNNTFSCCVFQQYQLGVHCVHDFDDFIQPIFGNVSRFIWHACHLCGFRLEIIRFYRLDSEGKKIFGFVASTSRLLLAALITTHLPISVLELAAGSESKAWPARQLGRPDYQTCCCCFARPAPAARPGRGGRARTTRRAAAASPSSAGPWWSGRTATDGLPDLLQL